MYGFNAPMNEAFPPQTIAHLLHSSWKNAESPLLPLRAETVLDYFMEQSNRFFDQHCDNNILRAQRSNVSLKNMTGIQYEVKIAQPPLFVIQKIKRNSPNDVTPLAHYYIIDGVVYQAPDLASVLCARLSNAVAPLTEALSIARKHVTYEDGREARCNIRGVVSESAQEEEKKTKRAPEDIPSTWFQRVRVDALLADLVAKYPPNAAADTAHAPKLDKDETASIATSTTSRARNDNEAKRQRL